MKCQILLFFLLGFSVSGDIRAGQETIVSKGRSIEVITAGPKKSGRYPLLVVAPAKKYTMTGKLFKKLEEGAVKLGYHVVRFNWRFVTQGTSPSKNLVEEAKDMEVVIDYFRKKLRPSKVVLSAKSFGSRVAMRANLADTDALLVLTPNCDSKNTFAKTYGKLRAYRGDVQITISRDDPYCDVSQMYGWMSQLSKNTTLYTLFGDHNFTGSPQEFGPNEKMAIESSLNWLAFQK